MTGNASTSAILFVDKQLLHGVYVRALQYYCLVAALLLTGMVEA